MFPAAIFSARIYPGAIFPHALSATPDTADHGTGPLTFRATVDATPPAGHFDHATVEGTL